MPFIPEAGIEEDEALFASGIYGFGITQTISVANHRIPLMLMTYVGALKSWIYAPIFRFWRPSPTSLRVPVILAGAATIWLFWSLLRRIAAGRSAIAGCVLLATDSLYLVTTCFDWGPVVLQHLLAVSGLLCLVRFHQEHKRRFLAAGFLLFGLGLWDKALFAWILSGIAVAAIVVFPKEVWNSVNPRNLGLATLAFCLGAAPLIFYNIRFPLKTVRSNAAFAADDVPGKSRMLLYTLSGVGLFDYLARNDPGEHPRDPQTTLERMSVRLSEMTGRRQSGFMGYAFLAALLLSPWLWFTSARRPMAFSLIAMAVAWVLMLLTNGGGGSVHHVILLWPLPVLFVAVALAEATRRAGRTGTVLLAGIVAFLAGSNLLVTNEYFARLIRNGPGVSWTDAIYPLSDCLRHVKSRSVYVNDWGMLLTLHLLNRGKLPLRNGGDPLYKPRLNPDDKRRVLERLSEPDSIFVSHIDALEMFKGINAKFLAMATEAGYRRVMVAQIADRNGRLIFEVFRFERESTS